MTSFDLGHVVVMGVWLGNLSIYDVLFFPCFGRQHVVFVRRGEISWTGILRSDDVECDWDHLSARAGTHSVIAVSMLASPEIIGATVTTLYRSWNFPCWNIVLTLTALFALLLVPNPDRLKKKITDSWQRREG